jgi:hypothetical protein
MQNSLNIYGHVTAGVIDDGPCQLPTSWKNISGLNNLSSEQQIALGWLPWILVEVPPGPNQVFNGETVVVESTQIVQTQLVRDMTPEETSARDQQFRNANKQQASQLLSDTDWTTIPDVSNPELSSPYLLNAAAYIAYRNLVRQIAIDPPVEQITEWPVKPQSQWSTT